MNLTAINISAFMAEEIEQLPDTAVMISINDEYDELEPLKLDRTSAKILTLRFTDITENLEYKDKTLHPINGKQALQIVEFVDRYKDKNFIVHCMAGISRSAAVCLYIHIVYGHELKKNFWQLSHPNPYVLGSLLIHKHQY